MTLTSDANLKKFLNAHLSEFEALVEVVRNGTKEATATSARKLFLNSARTDPAGFIRLTIGGILDNTVGYLYVPSGITPPRIEPDTVIYLEKIIDHWYVIKTT